MEAAYFKLNAQASVSSLRPAPQCIAISTPDRVNNFHKPASTPETLRQIGKPSRSELGETPGQRGRG